VARAFGFLTSFITVVGGCVALVHWLDAQDVSLFLIALVILAISGLLLFTRRRFFGPQGLDAKVWLFVPLGTAAYSALEKGSPGQDVIALVLSSAIFAATAGPLAFDVYEADRDSRKRCPDCWEIVTVHASVCRYCGHRWKDSSAQAPGGTVPADGVDGPSPAARHSRTCGRLNSTQVGG
jgi:hypothetical protein